MLEYLGTVAFLGSVVGVFYVCVCLTNSVDRQSSIERYRAEVERKLDMYLIA